MSALPPIVMEDGVSVHIPNDAKKHRKERTTEYVMSSWKGKGLSSGSTPTDSAMRREASKFAKLQRLQHNLPLIICGTILIVMCTCAVFMGLVYATISISKETHIRDGVMVDNHDRNVLTSNSERSALSYSEFKLASLDIEYLSQIKTLIFLTSVNEGESWVLRYRSVESIDIYDDTRTELIFVGGSKIVDYGHKGNQTMEFQDSKGVVSIVYNPEVHDHELSSSSAQRRLLGGQQGPLASAPKVVISRQPRLRLPNDKPPCTFWPWGSREGCKNPPKPATTPEIQNMTDSPSTPTIQNMTDSP